MSTKNNLLVTEIQRFCMHDGPGLRTVVFLKGCPLRCKWCHNPETQSAGREILFAAQKCIFCGACAAACERSAQKISPKREFVRALCVKCGKCTAACPTGALAAAGREMSVEEILCQVKRDLPFYGEDGGLTVSGGEPTAQPDGLEQLLRAAKAEGISTCLETCGAFSPALLPAILPCTDLFLFDIKDTDAQQLKENTGAVYSHILDNLFRIDQAGKKTVLRCILIPEVNLNDAHLRALAQLYDQLKNVQYIELLPYHPYGTSKSEQIGADEPTVYQTPEREQILQFAAGLKEHGICVKCFGQLQ